MPKLLLMCLERADEGEATVVDLNGVGARGGELLGGEGYELSVDNHGARSIAYHHLRRVRVIRSNRERATRNSGTEIGGLRRVCPLLGWIAKRIFSRKKFCAYHFN